MIPHFFFSSHSGRSTVKHWFRLLITALVLSSAASARDARTVMAELMQAERAEQAGLIEELSNYGDTIIADIYEAWRTGGIYLLEQDGGSQLLQFTDAQEWALVHNGAVLSLSEAEAASAKKQRPARALRKQMKRIIDTLGLKADNTALRIDSAIKLGRSQKAEFIPALEARLKVETDKQVISALQEALAISWLANGEDAQVVEAVQTLKALNSVAARAFLEELMQAEGDNERADSSLSDACAEALIAIERHMKHKNFLAVSSAALVRDQCF